MIQVDIGMEIPPTEYSPDFLEGMVRRMVMSYYKYGEVSKAYPEKVDAIGSLEMRLDKYKRDGNLEHLMDLANYAMIEFMHPRHPEAHFVATDAGKSPGRKWVGEVDPSQRSNYVEEWND